MRKCLAITMVWGALGVGAWAIMACMPNLSRAQVLAGAGYSDHVLATALGVPFLLGIPVVVVMWLVRFIRWVALAK